MILATKWTLLELQARDPDHRESFCSWRVRIAIRGLSRATPDCAAWRPGVKQPDRVTDCSSAYAPKRKIARVGTNQYQHWRYDFERIRVPNIE
jgi:hypothetical protein